MDGFEKSTRGTLPYFGPLYGPPKVEPYAGGRQVSKPPLPAHGPSFPLQRDSVPVSAVSPEPAAASGEGFRAQFVLFPQCNLTSR